MVPATFFSTFGIWMTYTHAKADDNRHTPLVNFNQAIFMLCGTMISNVIEVVSLPSGHTMFSTSEKDCFRALSVPGGFDNSRCPMGKCSGL
jgi:hypothetical protein